MAPSWKNVGYSYGEVHFIKNTAKTGAYNKKNSSQSEKSVFTWTDNNLDYRGVLAGAVMTAVKSL